MPPKKNIHTSIVISSARDSVSVGQVAVITGAEETSFSVHTHLFTRRYSLLTLVNIHTDFCRTSIKPEPQSALTFKGSGEVGAVRVYARIVRTETLVNI